MEQPVPMRVFVVCLVISMATAALAGPARLSAVSVDAASGETVVQLTVEDAAARPGVHMLSDHRLIVDLPGIVPSLRSHQIEAATSHLERVRIGIHNDPSPRTRVVLDLTGPTAYAVSFVPEGLEIRLRAAGTAPAVAAPPEPAATARPVETPAPTAQPTVAPPPESPSATATARPSPSPTAKPTPSPSPTAAPTPSPSPAPTAAPTPSPSPRPTHSPRPVSSAPLPTATVATDSAAPAVPTAAADPVPSGTVTIDFRDADVRTVIDLVANVGGYDVIFTPEVRGRITIQIIDGPWEEALDTVLAKKRLRATRHADLILVSPDDWE